MQPSMIASVTESEAAPLFRRVIELEVGRGAVTKATLRLSARGIVEAWLEGTPTSDERFAPGWTSYEWRTRVVEHDVTTLMRPLTTLALRVGNGWYRGYLGFTGARAIYGDERGAWAELTIEYADGHRERHVTDSSWRSSTGAVIEDDFYRGQQTDLRIDDEAWKLSDFDDAHWSGCRELPLRTDELVERTSPAVRPLAEVQPSSITALADDRVLVDFGQNLVGVVRLQVTGERGSTVVVRHAEVLENGELAVAPLRSATSTDSYRLSGREDILEPTLTFHGFRYAEISGLETPPAPKDIAAIVLGSDIPITGKFECSDPELNQLHSNVVWGMRGNFLSVPTDCPQRDERLGWTGDLSAFAPTAAYLGGVESFISDWLVDLSLEQKSSGSVPVVVPDALKFLDTGFPNPGPTAVWGDAAIWVPWALWEAYGHRDTLETAYPSMVSHMRAVEGLLTDGLWTGGFQFGDWLDPDAPADDPGRSKADTSVVSTACAYRDAAILAEAATVLGQRDDVERFEELRARIGTAFRDRFWANGRLLSDCATVYALAIEFGILVGRERQVAGDRLAEIVRDDRYRVSTGFAGTPFLLPALTSTGHVEEAYAMLLNPEIPGWLYAVRKGATTIWERWDSLLPDGAVNPNGMTSFNHYAFGAVADWMHRTVGGLAPLEPGYRLALVAPQPGGGLTHASTSTMTPYGELGVEWRIGANGMRVVVTVPKGVTAVVHVPGHEARTVLTGIHIFGEE